MFTSDNDIPKHYEPYLGKWFKREYGNCGGFAFIYVYRIFKNSYGEWIYHSHRFVKKSSTSLTYRETSIYVGYVGHLKSHTQLSKEETIILELSIL